MTLDFESMKKEIKDHMEAQPYHIVCSECGSDLDKETSIDFDYDLTITVHPCQCLKGE